MVEADEDGVEIAGYDVTVDVDGWRAMQVEIERLRAVNAEMSELLSRAVEMTGEPECYYDHHGYCQAHNLEPKGECWVERAIVLVDKEAGDD